MSQVRLLLTEAKPLTPLQRMQARSFLDFAEETMKERLTVARPRKDTITT